ncbi:MAG: 2-isopropylmalate synthase [Desulfobacteraceae bacterium]|nr:2-isopropylmalate synthase [Desulfobacteraceae bacterium]
MKKITIFDSTLRDGAQAPGNNMTVNQKLIVAKQLEKIGIDTIEAGFPVSSPDDFEAVSLIAQEVKNCKICGFSRSQKGDIDKVGVALRNSNNCQIEILGSASEINYKYKRNLTQEDIIAESETLVKYTKANYPNLEISYGLEDAARGDIGFLKELSHSATNAGAKVIVVGDTVGFANPYDFGIIVGEIKKQIPEDVTLSVHCHNDLGMAVANSLAGVANGASEIQVSINGIGERCGNTQMEAMVLALVVHPSFGKTRIKPEFLSETSQMLSDIIERKPAYEAPVIGKNAFSTEAGLHMDGIMKNPMVYQFIDPKVIGRKQDFILGYNSGKSGFEYKLNQLGYQYSSNDITQLMQKARGLRDINDYKLIQLYNEIQQ